MKEIDARGFFRTVGDLKTLLQGIPDDRIIICQVTAEDGTTWNMWPSFTGQVQGGTIAAITFTHIELKTLPKSQ